MHRQEHNISQKKNYFHNFLLTLTYFKTHMIFIKVEFLKNIMGTIFQIMKVKED